MVCCYCWSPDPDWRPTLPQLVDDFEKDPKELIWLMEK